MTKRKSGISSLIELVVIVAIALALAFGIQAFLIKPYRIPSESMEPTLAVGQRVLVNRIGNDFNNPSVGEIVVFHPPQGAVDPTGGKCGVQVSAGELCPKPTAKEASVNFIKRVVAGPGDRISVINGHVIRNGKLQKESFIRPCPAGGETCTFNHTITIPPGYWFMMGDNRGQSDDSRFWGPVPKKWIIGGAFFTYWPLDRIGFL
ncbi:MAG TPA: signal peptidase I [Solirubrobacteraceae bacterium]|nr:signal peptidase I [Solirubrobacteraceae bacterium]